MEKYAERQKVVSLEEVDRDLFALAVDRGEGIAAAATFQVRDGKILGSRQQYLNRIRDESDQALMQMVVERYYSEATFFPDEVFLDTGWPIPIRSPGSCGSRRARACCCMSPSVATRLR